MKWITKWWKKSPKEMAPVPNKGWTNKSWWNKEMQRFKQVPLDKRANKASNAASKAPSKRRLVFNPKLIPSAVAKLRARRYAHYKRLKAQYVIGQIIKGIIAILGLLVVLWITDLVFEEPVEQLLTHLRKERIQIYGGFAISELLLGLLPPDLFVLALPKVPIIYIQGVIIIASISHAISFVNYFIGSKLSETPLYIKFIGKRFRKELRQLKRFGGVLIVLSALTPISFSVICILVGALQYPFRSFVLFSIARLVRFALYGYLLWPVGGA